MPCPLSNRLCAPICYVCVCMVYACMWVKVYVQIRSMLDVFLHCSLPCPWSQDIFLSHHPAALAGGHLLGSAYLYSALHSTGLRTCTSVPSSYMNAGDASQVLMIAQQAHYSLSYLLSHVCPPVLLPSFHRSLSLWPSSLGFQACTATWLMTRLGVEWK